MAERTIGIGDTGSFRYIGIKPPLDDTTTEEVAEQIILPDWVDHKYVYRQQFFDGDDPDHTELGINVGSAIDGFGVETVDNGIVHVARQVAQILRNHGDTVEIIEGIYPTDYETPIFGRDWNEI